MDTEIKRRIILVTPAFCKAALLKDQLDYLYSKVDLTGVHKHYVGDNHYPVDKKENSKKIKQYAQEHACEYVDNGGDLGLHRGVNNILKIAGFTKDDLMIGCDPDDRISKDSIQALIKVMGADPTLAVLGLGFWVIDDQMKNKPELYTSATIAGEEVVYHRDVCMWGVAAFQGKFLTEIGGLMQPNAYYGGLEISLYHKYKPMGLKLGYLTKHRTGLPSEGLTTQNKNFFDSSYHNYKLAHVRGFQGSFEDYLKERGEIK